MRSVSVLSSEEGEASEYPSSQRSTLESNPDVVTAGARATVRGAHALRAMHSYGRSDESETTPTRSRLTVPDSLKRMKAVGSRDEPLQRIPTLQVTSAHHHHESPLKRMAAVVSQDISSMEPLRRAPAISQQDSLKRMAAVSTDDLSATEEDRENMVITIQCLEDSEASVGEGNLTIAPETSHGSPKNHHIRNVKKSHVLLLLKILKTSQMK